MTKMVFSEFGGMVPRFSNNRVLPMPYAIAAVNYTNGNGGMQAIGYNGLADAPYNSVTHAFGANLKSIYPYNGAWLASDFARQYVKSPISQDTFNRLYYTDSNYPKVRSGAAEYRLGLPRPGTPTVTIVDDGTAVVDVTKELTIAYIVTLVDGFGAEGPSSLPTPLYNVWMPTFEVELDLSLSMVTGNYNLGSGAFFRIYRSNSTVAGDGLFQYLVDVPYGTTSYTDTMLPENLQEAIQTQDWVGPPDDNASLFPFGPLASLVEYPGGILAGHSGNTVYFSLPYLPHAWPYSYSISDQIMGIAVIQGGLLVVTDGKPRLFTGSDPSLMVEVPIEFNDACLNPQSIVDMGDYALYVTARGIALARGNTVELVTEELYDKSAWSLGNGPGAYPNISAYRNRFSYVLNYSNGTFYNHNVYDFSLGQNPPNLSILRLHADAASPASNMIAAYFWPAKDVLYFVKASNTATVFATSPTAPAELSQWQRGFFTDEPVAFNCMRVQYFGTCTIELRVQRTEQSPLFDVVGNWVLPISSSELGSVTFKFACPHKGRDWTLVVTNFSQVFNIQVSDSLSEIS